MNDDEQSNLRVCFSGGIARKGDSGPKRGSFEMRGRQVASRVDTWSSDWDDCCYPVDVFVMVKKFDSRCKLGKRKVFDIVDSWSQKRGHDAGAQMQSYKDVIKYFAQAWKTFPYGRLDSFIFPNKLMRKHLRHVVPHSTTIYHHYHPGIPINPVREKLTTVGYQGKTVFLGEWEEVIQRACDRLGLTFVRNPKNLADVDVVVAARGGEYANIMSRSYKSNVKLANCYGSGTPAVMWPEQSYLETDCGEVRFFDSEKHLLRALDELRSYEVRRHVHERFLRASWHFELDTIVQQYREYFREVMELQG